MRTALLLAFLVALTACSEVDPGVFGFRSLAEVVVSGNPGPLAVARTPAEAEALADRLGLAEPLTADFERETLVAVSTAGACPNDGYTLTVTDVVVTTRTVTISGVVGRPLGGSRVLASPVAVVAVGSLLTDDELEADLSGAAGDCTLE